ncbi:Mfd protein [Candidatus Pantoea carbekii]|uniref:Transcription-repair-coupling factor n=1 Tax=Candidatus Pantoea carbekii TaxID=1235990 RepID=U3U6S1_9GAMM|nr:Mfd protein [Candidatus Pantoea carbekii]
MLEKIFYPLPTKAGEQRILGQCLDSATAFECANITQYHNGLILIITSDMQSTLRLYKEIRQFTMLPVFHFCDWKTLPYDTVSPSKEIISARLSILYRLPVITKGILIIPVNTLMQRVCPCSFLHHQTLAIYTGQKLTCDLMDIQLKHAGYNHVNQITRHSEYSIRNGLMDLYPMGSNQPYRISFFDSQIDNLYLFSIDSQRILKEVNKINLLPAYEFPTDKTAIELFCIRWKNIFGVSSDSEPIYQQVRKGILPQGIEYWFPLFFKNTTLKTIFSYLPDNTIVLSIGNFQKNAERFWQNVNTRFEHGRVNLMRPLLTPSALWLNPKALQNELTNWPNIQLRTESLPKKQGYTNLGYQVLPNIKLQQHSGSSTDTLKTFLKSFSGKVIYLVKNESSRNFLQNLLKSINVSAYPITYFKEAIKYSHSLIIGASNSGFIDTQRQWVLICENDLLDPHIKKCSHYDQNLMNSKLLIANFKKLQLGQPMVHFNHGVGRYLGLIVLEVGGIKSEYLMLAYACDTKLYVPISSLHLINHYSAGSDKTAPLHKLGNDSWLRTRQTATKKIHDVAVELLKIYAQRTARIGFPFRKNHELYQLFCKQFPFQITSDQKQAINEVLHDMCQPLPMDRLVCGDVGFGKTEVAMRAAFLATVENKKQVVVLVPTTLLAQQHYDNFRNRFADWSVCIQMLSRFRSAKQQNEIFEQVSSGKIDILISTYNLFLNKINWYNLGLLIVDEEHRFGVRHKERIKAMCTNIDVLTLTATPIPRTLNMAMNGIRDLSIIATPPARRLAIKTFVKEYDSSIVREAILHEILRGGQTYYLYNDVEHIENAAKKLEILLPEARIVIAHGQMRERDLEKVMNDFHHHCFDVLVCSTIIETGIDVPNANTIIIERADQFGLAQLHQLRGRVGRSYHQAYAWLLTPPPKVITQNAHERLKAIASLEDLGIGFTLATHDLEIRGAGELLGEEQSGQIETIGFPLYMELLENAVSVLKTGNEPTLEQFINKQTEIDIRIPALLPEKFIPNVNTRLLFYKRLASANNEKEVIELKIEIIDRFGKLPNIAHNLFDITLLKLSAHKVGIQKIELNETDGYFEFMAQNHINLSWLIDLIQKNPKQWKLDGPTRLKFKFNPLEHTARIKWAHNFIADLEKNQM